MRIQRAGDASVVKAKWKPYPMYIRPEPTWLGSVPNGWHPIPLKRLTNFVSRGDSPDYVEESSIPIINQGCIYWDGLRLDKVKYQCDTHLADWKGLLQQGDVLINSTGTGTLGRAV